MPLFLLFSAIAVIGAVVMIIHRNPVVSALSLAVSFLAVAALMIQLDAELMGIFQILVYAGAIMVLFLFIIMLLDVKTEDKRNFTVSTLLGAGFIGGLFLLQLGAVILSFDEGKKPFVQINTDAALASREAAAAAGNQHILPTANELLAEGKVPSGHLLGETLMGRYLLPMQVIACLLLVASIGVVILSQRPKAERQLASKIETKPEN